MMDLLQIKKLHDKWFEANQTTRRRVASEMTFYHITHWESSRIEGTELSYRGEFDKLKKAGNKILSVLKANPVQVDFEAVDEDREDGAELIDGLYRRDARRNTSLEAFSNAKSECIVGGVGAWRLFTEYEKRHGNSKNQVIRREPVYEANNKLFWDDNAKLKDKSDAMGASYLAAYSEDGYKALHEELTGEERGDINPSSFAFPEHSYTFPWVSGQNDLYYVTTFYYKKEINDTVVTLAAPDGREVVYLASSIKDVMDELIDEGYRVTDEKPTKRWEVTQYIASGEKILSEDVIAGENIPFIPVYANRAYVEGEEHYEGIVKVAKDPTILRDFQLSYLADIVSRSPRPKPLLYPEQIAGLEDMWNIPGSEDNFAYKLINSAGLDGRELPLGVGQMPAQEVPQALMLSLQESEKAIDQSLPADIPRNLVDTDLSGEALREVNRMMNEQSFMYQDAFKHALRRDGVVYASMAAAVMDAPRNVKVTLPDGTAKSVKIMEMVMDEETGEMVVMNDITNTEFEVFAEVGASFESQQEETFTKLGDMAINVERTDPEMAGTLRLYQLTLMDGGGLIKDVRENARKKLILSGQIKPETDEEKQLLQESQQNPPPPEANMVMAQAEMERAKAEQADVQRMAQNDELDNQINQGKLEISRFDAATKRLEAQVAAETAQADMEFNRIDTMTRRLDAVNKFRASVNG